MLILVVESESRHAERAKDGLGSDGWRVEIASSCPDAATVAAMRSPQLVVVNAELPGARDLLRRFARSHGGPGAVALLPEVPSVAATEAAHEADESLAKPFQESTLRQVARRVLTADRSAKTHDDATTRRLTSHELFGDLLAEVENETVPQAPAALPVSEASQAPPARPASDAPPAAAAAHRPSPSDAQLEQTLSGMLRDDRPRPAPGTPVSRRGDSVDDLLSRDLPG